MGKGKRQTNGHTDRFYIIRYNNNHTLLKKFRIFNPIYYYSGRESLVYYIYGMWISFYILNKNLMNN